MGERDDGCCTLDEGHDGACVHQCEFCNGTGQCIYCNGDAGLDDVTWCEGCDGQGICTDCSGEGEVVSDVV